MKLRAIIPNEPGHASAWWRIIRPFTMLREYGFDAAWHNHDDLVSLDVSDAVVVIHRIIPANPKEYIAKLYRDGARAVVYSLDDLTTNKEALEEYLIESGGLTSFAINKITERIPLEIETINLCEEVLVSTEELANLVQEDIDTPITVLENALDLDWYNDRLSKTPERIGNSDTVYIGYASGRRPERDLLDMAKAWGRIQKDFQNVRFVVAGWQPDVIDKHINLENKVRIPWRTLEEWPQSMQVDIGCCPLADTIFNRGKSPIKYYEYTMAGAAVVASSLVYNQVIGNYITGYVAVTEDDWYMYLANLIEERKMRKVLQATAQYDIVKNKSLQVTIDKWVDYFKGHFE